MPDPKHTVETIRAFLASGTATEDPLIQGAAVDYAEMCREANFRLRRCGELLHDGLRADALALAAKPDLLELVAALEFEESVAWEHVCTSMNLARPGRLEMHTAIRLVEAKRQQELLEQLLAKHRYLALSRAQPAQRLAILRQLAAADPQTPSRQQDVTEFEEARIAMMRSEIAVAVRCNDLGAMQKLLAEVNAGPWVTPVPSELTDTLSRVSAALIESTAIAKLQALAPRVGAAVASQNYEEARQIFMEWGTVVKGSTILVPPDLRQVIMPLAHWLDEQEERRERELEFRGLCQMLESAIQSGMSAEQLKPYYQQAISFGSPMPQDVLAQYQRVLDQARLELQAEKKNQYFFASGLVLLIALALLAVGFVIIRSAMH